MVDSNENYKFDMGVRGLIVSQKILARSWKIHFSPKGIINALTNIRIFNNYLPKPDNITGEPQSSQLGDDLKLISGNRILSSARQSDGEQSILG